MNDKTQSTIPHLLVILFILSACAFFPQLAMAQNRPATPSSTTEPTCCWIDVKTGERVPSVPLDTKGDLFAGTFREGLFGTLTSMGSQGGKTAFNPITKQNFALEPDGCWIDVKTGERVPSVPLDTKGDLFAGTFREGLLGTLTSMRSQGGKTAFNPITGQNFALVPCPPPKEKKVIEEKKEVCDIEFGYDYMRAPDESAKSLNGFGGSLFCNVKPWISVGGDFGALFGSTTDTVGTTKIDLSLHRQTYLFGPQFNFYPNDKVKIFVHPLFGGVHDTTKTTIGTTTTDFSANAFAMAFGGGVDVNLNNHFAIRPIQFDYVPTHFGGAWQSNYRVSAGVVIRLGKKR